MLRLNKKVWSNLRSFLIVWERRTGEVRGCSFRLKRTKLNYRFHNPNSAEETADFLCKLLIEANVGKVERAIEVAALYPESKDYILENLLENKEKLCVG
ncbi:hypothetical protein [Roseburia hominis]|uniref:hypothetical protein n=1 Tax=Roseburia hominis TaxID=301301 RepID=UPI002F3F2FE1